MYHFVQEYYFYYPQMKKQSLPNYRKLSVSVEHFEYWLENVL